MARLGPPRVVAPFATSETKSTTEYAGVAGVTFVDPDNPLNTYMLVDCQKAMQVGEVVVINGSGQASQAASTSVGLLGIIVATVAGSDTLAYAQISGSNDSVIVTSGVTTAAGLVVAVTTDSSHGYFDIDSSGGNIVFGARAISAASTATSPVPGGALATVLMRQGGAWVNGLVSQNLITS
jgi:hypothetical protein